MKKKSIKKVVKTGRPSDFTQVLADKICLQIVEGSSLVKICKSLKMPHVSTVYRWLSDDDKQEFCDRYVRARELQADTLADEIIEIADTCVSGDKIKILPDGSQETTRGDMIERSRLKVDARKWKASKLAPKKYGDKLQLDGEIKAVTQIVVHRATEPYMSPIDKLKQKQDKANNSNNGDDRK